MSVAVRRTAALPSTELPITQQDDLTHDTNVCSISEDKLADLVFAFVNQCEQTQCQKVVDSLADINYQSKTTQRTALHHTCIWGRTRLCQYIVTHHNCDVTLVDCDGATCLDVAVMSGSLGCVRALLDEFEFSRSMLSEALHCLCSARCEKVMEIARLLVAHGADIHFNGFYGRQATHIAAREGNTDMMTLLVELGADLGVRDDYGLVPLSHATHCLQHEITSILMGAGADPTIGDTQSVSPLHVGARAGDTDFLTAVLKQQPQYVHLQTNTNHTLLHFAAAGRSPTARSTVALLLAFGCDPYLVNTNDQTALDLANTTSVKSLLISATVPSCTSPPPPPSLSPPLSPTTSTIPTTTTTTTPTLSTSVPIATTTTTTTQPTLSSSFPTMTTTTTTTTTTTQDVGVAIPQKQSSCLSAPIPRRSTRTKRERIISALRNNALNVERTTDASQDSTDKQINKVRPRRRAIAGIQIGSIPGLFVSMLNV